MGNTPLSNQTPVTGDTFEFPEFIPPTGRWTSLPRVHARWLLQRLQGAHETLVRAAMCIALEIEQGQGQRFAISSRSLGAMLGMSQSTGSRCLRKLRALGILALWRKHYTRYSPRIQRWIGSPAVHEVALCYQISEMTHPYRGTPPSPPVGVSHVPRPGEIP